MKLVWSPEAASKAYIDTVKSCELFQGSGVAELVSAMAAGWDSKLIVETWSRGGLVATSIGLAIAGRHTGGRHVCIVPDEHSRTEYTAAMGEVGMSPEIIVGEVEDVLGELKEVDFMVVDSRRKDFARAMKVAKLGSRGAVLVCKNASSRSAAGFRWKSIVDGSSRQLVRSVFLPVGKGLDIAHVAATRGKPGSSKGERRWIKHVNRQTGEEYMIRK